MILALLLAAQMGSSEDALRIVVRSLHRPLSVRLPGNPDILSETLQPDSDYVEAMADDVKDAALRNEMAKPHKPVSLWPILKTGWHMTTSKEIDAIVAGAGTAQEKLDRFNARYPNGVMRYSAVGQKPDNSHESFVSYEWLTARIDPHGDFQVSPAEIGLVELIPEPAWNSGWRVGNTHSVTLEH